MPHLDLTINVPTLLTILGGVAYVVRIFNMLKDYPPHRHEGDIISFPKGFEPPKSQHMTAGRG